MTWVGPLYLETDTSSIGLRARLLQVGDGMNSGCDEIPENSILCLIAFTSKGLSCPEWCYSNIECETLRIEHWLENFNTTVLQMKNTSTPIISH